MPREEIREQLGLSMTEPVERWMQLAQQAHEASDPQTLDVLATQLILLLEEKGDKLHFPSDLD